MSHFAQSDTLLCCLPLFRPRSLHLCVRGRETFVKNILVFIVHLSLTIDIHIGEIRVSIYTFPRIRVFPTLLTVKQSPIPPSHKKGAPYFRFFENFREGDF